MADDSNTTNPPGDKPGFTPGPWGADSYECKPGDLPEGAFGIFEIGEDDPALAIVGPWGNSDANAHLIAAAPDLYDALSELVYEATHLSPLEDDGSHVCRISKEALAKARKALSLARGDSQ
jgi:hypothetical protein